MVVTYQLSCIWLSLAGGPEPGPVNSSIYWGGGGQMLLLETTRGSSSRPVAFWKVSCLKRFVSELNSPFPLFFSSLFFFKPTIKYSNDKTLIFIGLEYISQWQLWFSLGRGLGGWDSKFRGWGWEKAERTMAQKSLRFWFLYNENDLLNYMWGFIQVGKEEWKGWTGKQFTCDL